MSIARATWSSSDAPRQLATSTVMMTRNARGSRARARATRRGKSSSIRTGGQLRSRDAVARTLGLLFLRAQLGVDLGQVGLVVGDHLVQDLGRQLRIVAQDALAIVRFAPVEGDGAHGQARAGHDGGAALNSGIAGDMRIALGSCRHGGALRLPGRLRSSRKRAYVSIAQPSPR